MTNGSHSKQNANSTGFSHRRKSITIVLAVNLSIALSYQSSFNAINFTSRTNFNSINPSTTNRLLIRRKRDKIPSAIVFKCLHLINHGLSPSRMNKCLMNIIWNLSR
ncbi:hypothetical protein VIGAN_11229100 [Vigna angularis var. angularis]|uniref:Uncharacterized protein n=1 Tax=Vigna angularis var. angularis TaxID=157739 RepID=A0A0S3TCP2_PHAAN|nr:hypothetical protein VIGAN_11229100 [Vigna angularis var. angularis]